jgi:hypothetical protein
VRVTCQFCRITRHFEPADLERLLGDVAFRHALGAMRCEKCRHDRTFRKLSHLAAGRIPA